jgi:hypothetical protein
LTSISRFHQRLRSANSSRCSAAAIPRGTDIAAVTIISQTLPRMPARKPVVSGNRFEA